MIVKLLVLVHLPTLHADTESAGLGLQEEGEDSSELSFSIMKSQSAARDFCSCCASLAGKSTPIS